MGRYYGEYIDSRPNAEIVVFAVDELDDDALISFMEDKPAYKRTAKDVQQIRRKGEVPKACRSPRLPLTKTRSLNLAAQLLVLGNE